MMKVLLIAGLLAAGLVPATQAQAETVTYSADLSAANEVPPTGTGGTGHVTATFDTLTKDFSYKADYQGLTGAATAAHFHGPAPKGQNAPVAVPITGSLASPIQGKTTLTDDQAKALAGGNMYFNIHTADHKNGEIRGQLEKGM